MAMGSRYFDGTNDVLGSVTMADPGFPFTIAAWCYWPADTNYRTIVSYNNAAMPYRHYIHARQNVVVGVTYMTFYVGSYRSVLAQGSIAVSFALPADLPTWVHVVGVWEATNKRSIYVNGGLGGTSVVNVTVTAPSKLYIGANVAAEFWSGNIAHVSVWDVALNANEIYALYKGGSPANARRPSVKGYWPLHGMASPEPNIVGGLGSMTVAGAVASGTGPHVIGPQW